MKKKRWLRAHLTRYLLNEKAVDRVVGLGHTKAAAASGGMAIEPCDILDAEKLRKIIRREQPDYVFHLAAQSKIPPSWKQPADTLQTNITGSANLLEAIRTEAPKARVLMVSTSDVYGKSFLAEKPLTEESKPIPLNPYGASKLAMEVLSNQYATCFGLHVITVRPFNHIGPGCPPSLVVSDWAKQIMEIKLGIRKEKTLSVGSLSKERDFSDVRDVVRAYWMAIEKGEPGEVYNICSEKTRSLKSVMESLCTISGTSVLPVEEQSRLRPNDIKIVRGSCLKFRNKTGWKPEIPFDQTLSDTLQYWEQQLTSKQ